jgi:hypothetical protein
MPYDPATPVGQVRLLIVDTSDDPVFTDDEINAFLALEGQVVKLAAAQALDAIASDEALTSKRITDHDLSTDGPATAAALRAHANSLRAQAQLERSRSDDEGYFEIIGPPDPYCWPSTL